MLTHLNIRDFAIIEQLSVDFHGGLTIVTGETGAGKSIVVDALGLVLGSRASGDFIRVDADRAVVEAVFVLSADARSRIDPLLEERGIDTDEQLIIRRVLRRSGRHQAYVNGSVTALGTLQEIVADLVDIAGQHEHYSLLKPTRHLHVLDDFGQLNQARHRLAQGVAKLRQLEREIDTLESGERDRLARTDFLRFQIEEIDAAHITDSDRELDERLNIVRHGEQLHSSATTASERLYDSDQAVIDVVSNVGDLLGRAAHADARLQPHADMLETIRIQLAELAMELRDYAETLDVDPGELDALERRHNQLQRLTRKHGGEIDDVLAARQSMQGELEELEGADGRIEEARAEADELRRALMAEARTLASSRTRAAGHLARLVESELSDLGMTSCEFAVRQSFVAEDGNPTPDLAAAAPSSLKPHGLDQIEFVIAPNPGEGLKPLARIASGGELSRIMIALKNALISTDPVATYIFDEADSGVGGPTADTIGQKMRKLADAHQVIAITHLAQIAAHGHHHLRVEKSVAGDRTVSSVVALDRNERVEEIARMIGGSEITEKTREHAGELLDQADPS